LATIHDVARLAGVASITVSRAVNNSGYVSAEKRARIEAAIAELGYVPNELARSLRSKGTHTLGMVLTDITNPFWTTVARGLEDAASDAGYNVFLCNSDESEAEEEVYLRTLLQKQVDGVLLVPASSSTASLEYLRKHATPVVVIDRRMSYPEIDMVRGDSEGGAYQLTHLLLELGHRRIGVLGGREEVSTVEDRVAGYRRALAESGVEFDPDLVVYGAFTQDSGYEMVGSILKKPSPPTALFAINNFIAIGALRALRDVGIRVPDDMAMVTFDDLPYGLVLEPFFTVASQPAYEMGRRATELLLARLSGDQLDGPQEVVLPTQLIVRTSSGVPIGQRAV
jgi:LacI family transcriptional regulator